MVKKLLIAFGSVIVVLGLLIIVAGVIVYKKADKDVIASLVSEKLNRQVYIEKINANIFSVISGIEVKNVAISNYKTPAEIKSMQGKPVADGDVFAGMESLRFKVKLLPLLKKQVELKELVLFKPVVNLSKNKQGVMNIDDLIKSKKPESAEKKEPSRPISADDVPLSVFIGEIGMKDATINFYDGEHDQRFQIYKLTTLARDINIDPKDLKNRDEMKVEVSMGIKTVGQLKTGSVKSFDFTMEADGKVAPFDVNTRLLEPEALIHIGIPDGEISGLQIFNSIASIPLLGDYLGEYIGFLKDKQQWKDSRETGLDVHYKAGKVDIKNGKLDLKQAKILFDGSTDIKTKAVDMNMNVVMSKEINEPVKASLAKRIDSLMGVDVKKYADSGKLAEASIQPLFNKDGAIDLKMKAAGTTEKPDVKLVKPQLDTLGEVIKSAAGSVAVEAGKSALKETVKKSLGEDQQKILEGVGNLFKSPAKK